MNTKPNAKILLDSISPTGIRLTTLEVTMHRFVLAELNTHRVFSRNSASSRAIPIQKQIDKVMNDPALPLEWGSNQRGMQAGPEISESKEAERVWLAARLAAVNYARMLDDVGVHKQLVNRVLEPFMWHTVIITATDWENFFELRCNEMAQPEIRVPAESIREAMKHSMPAPLRYDEWHTPLIFEEDGELDLDTRLAVSAARCARVSYLTHDGRRDIEADLVLYKRLVEGGHWSPLEHVARPLSGEVEGNFRGWMQLRHQVSR